MGVHVLTNEQGYSQEVTGDINSVILTPPKNHRFIVKGMLVHGSGNNGESSLVTSGGRLLIKLYHSNQATINPAGRTHIQLGANESISIVATGRVANKTFFGVSVEVEEVRL